MSAGIKRADLEALAQAKLQDAQILYAAKRYSNAYYLAGYTIELALKACISIQFVADTIPDKDFVKDIYTGHDLVKLMKLAGLSNDLKLKSDQDENFAANWAITAQWRETSRYTTVDSITAQSLLESITDSTSGVFPWIMTYW
jgi:hypothetical protein